MGKNRASITGGLIMIVVGVIFLLLNMFPAIVEQLNFERHWPLLILVVGLFFLLSAPFASGNLAIPGSIVMGVGAILYYQNLTGNWGSWAYVWTLIPGFVGVGLMLASWGNGRISQRRSGFRLILVSGVLFLIFASFFRGLGDSTALWPLLLILFGLWMIVRNRLGRG